MFMLKYLTFAIILPLLIATIFWLRYNRRIVLTIYPVATVLSFVINHIALVNNWWDYHPWGFIFDVGIYSIVPTVMVYYIHHTDYEFLKIFGVATLALTAYDVVLLNVGILDFLTFYDGVIIDYLMTAGKYIFLNTLVYLYYSFLIRVKVFR